jgi:hypothetical protein
MLRFLLLLLLTTTTLSAQSGGRSFVLSFGANPGVEQSDGWLRIYMTAPRATDGSVFYGGTIVPFTVAAGGVTVVGIPATLAAGSGLQPKGIRVDGNDSLTVVGVNHGDGSTDAFLVYPVEGLDTAYTVPGWPSDEGGEGSFLTVAGVTDTTRLRMRSTRAGDPDIVAMVGAGETYTMRGIDLTGWSINASHPVALFAGARSGRVPATPASSTRGYSHMVEQILPTSRWDTSALALPHPAQPRNIFTRYRVTAAFDSTVIRINGISRFRLDRGGSFEEDLEASNLVTSTAPVLVSQYEMSPFFQSGVDPYMVLVSPTAQLLSSYRFIALPTAPFDRHYGVISIPRSQTASLRIDGAPLPDTLRWIFNGVSGFSFAMLRLEPGAHLMHSTTGTRFSLMISGYGDGESYGYLAPMKQERLLERFDRRSPFLQSIRTEECVSRVIVLRDTGEIVSGFGPDALAELHLQEIDLVATSYSADSLAMTLRLLIRDPSRDAAAQITLRDRAGNLRVIRLQFPRTLLSLEEIFSDSVVTLSVPIGSARCDNIIIRNSRSETLVLTEARLAANNAFSIPPSILPLSIPPGGSLPILICGDPTAGALADTLYISDSCGLVAAFALRLQPEAIDAIDECGSDLRISPMSLAKGRARGVLSVAPNPSSGGVTTIRLRADDAGTRLQLLSSAGEIALDREVDPRDELQTIAIDSGELPAGEYLVRLVSGSSAVGEISRLVVVR